MTHAIPAFPKGLILWHPAVGPVPVTIHAWERFVENCRNVMMGNLRQDAPQAFFVEKMMSTFVRSEEIDVSMHVAIRKMLKHKGVDARYFDFGKNILRFVVVRVGSVLVTVTPALKPPQ